MVNDTNAYKGDEKSDQTLVYTSQENVNNWFKEGGRLR